MRNCGDYEHPSAQFDHPFDDCGEGGLNLVEAIDHEEEKQMLDEKRGEPASRHYRKFRELGVEEVAQDEHNNAPSEA